MGIKKIKILSIAVIGLLSLLVFPGDAWAPLGACVSPLCINQIRENHADLRRDVNSHTSEKFTEHREWILEDFFKDQVLPALMLFTEQMSAAAMHQTFAIGTFLDAKHQLETQRLLQELQTEAHKDYQPSEDFCYFGTNVRSLAASEQKAKANALYLSRRQMARQLGQNNIAGAQGRGDDKAGRWREFTESFCDPQDNNWFAGAGSNGLELACGAGASNPTYTNADIDYTRLVENARTITLDDPPADLTMTAGLGISPIRRAVFALSNNLYGHNVLKREGLSAENLQGKKLQGEYLALRSVAAKRSVAENSFNAIVGIKSAGTATYNSAVDAGTYQFLGSILKEVGIPEAEIDNMIGRKPSYYAQLELLAKKIYQNPDFYADLYDKPANVKRKRVALQAIELMLDRAIYESQVRQELATSVLLSARLREPFKEVNAKLQAGN
ncbi:MAG: hypothetical protein ACRBCT_02600 [Alphaproteobacteria bacterium]